MKIEIKLPLKNINIMTDFEQFEKNKTKLSKIEKEHEKFNPKLTKEDLDKNDEKIKAQEKLIKASCKKLDNFKEITNKEHIQS